MQITFRRNEEKQARSLISHYVKKHASDLLSTQTDGRLVRVNKAIEKGARKIVIREKDTILTIKAGGEVVRFRV